MSKLKVVIITGRGTGGIRLTEELKPMALHGRKYDEIKNEAKKKLLDRGYEIETISQDTAGNIIGYVYDPKKFGREQDRQLLSKTVPKPRRMPERISGRAVRRMNKN